MGDNGQRIDKWLWFARIVRTRAGAQELAASGHVRVNRQRVEASSRLVRIGDVLTLAAGNRVRVLRVLGFVSSRGGPGSAAGLYEELTDAKARVEGGS